MISAYLKNHSLKYHLCVALLIGFVLRVSAAYFSYGPLAMDDYIDGIYPALEWSNGNPIKLAAWRSPLLVWELEGAIRVARLCGVSNIVDLVRIAGGALGFLSLIGVFGAYLFAQKRERVFGAVFIYLMSFYCLMPFVSTRAFGEAASVAWIALGMGLMEIAGPWFFVGALALGMGTLLRFHNGIFFVALLFGHRKNNRAMGFLLFAGFITLGVAGWVDSLAGRTPLSTLFALFHINSAGGVEFGREPWYSHFVFVLVLAIFPFSMKTAGRFIGDYLPWVACLLLFVVVHSLIPHKEERFMLPIVPFLLLWIAFAWSEYKGKFFLWFYIPIQVIVLAAATFTNSQGARIEPIVRAQRISNEGEFWQIGINLEANFLGKMFLNPGSQFRFEEKKTFEKDEIENYFKGGGKNLTLVSPFIEALIPVEKQAQCGPIIRNGSFADWIIYSMNPSHNVRRAPVYSVNCYLGSNPSRISSSW